MYKTDVLTVPANIVGIPAISIPCGKSQNMPVGLQIMGKMYGEESLLNIALAYEEAV